MRKLTLWGRVLQKQVTVNQLVAKLAPLCAFMAHCRVHVTPPRGPAAGRIKAVDTHTFEPYSFKIHYNTNLPPKPTFPIRSLELALNLNFQSYILTKMVNAHLVFCTCCLSRQCLLPLSDDANTVLYQLYITKILIP